MPFPLPITAFEDYMLADDRPAYPMNFFIRMKFSGTLSEHVAEMALREVAARHPLLTARLQHRGRWRARWVENASGTIPLHRLACDDSEWFPACDGLDLERESGLVGYRIRCGSADHVLWQFHHACCDGLGSFQVLEDWMIAYARIAGLPLRDGAGRSLEIGRLAQRGRFGLTPYRLLKKFRKQAVGLAGVRQFLMRHPAPLLSGRVTEIDERLSVQYPVALTHAFSREQTTSLRSRAKRLQCTVNDLLARDLFLALGHFRQQHACGGAEDWLRLSVPMNLRRASDRSLPAANVVSLVFLDRRQPDFKDPEQLLRSIHDEMRLIKTHELGLTFVLSLAIARRLPGGLKRQGDRKRCTATCLFTNPGPVFHRAPLPKDDQHRVMLGDVVLEALDLVAPIRPYTGAAFTVFHYANRLMTTLSYDPRMLSESEAAELLRQYATRVATTAVS